MVVIATAFTVLYQMYVLSFVYQRTYVQTKLTITDASGNSFMNQISNIWDKLKNPALVNKADLPSCTGLSCAKGNHIYT